MSGGGGVNAGIPLAFNPIPAGPSIGQAIQDASAYEALQEQKQRAQSQNAMRAIMQDPANLAANGLPTQNAISKMMGYSPATALAMQKNMLELQRGQFDLSLKKLNVSDALEGMMRSTASDASLAYDEAIKAKKSPEEAQRLAQDVYSQGFDRIRSSGAASPEQMNSFPQSFDPIKTPRGAEWMKQRMAERKAAQEDRRLDLTERGQNVQLAAAGQQPGRAAEHDVQLIADDRIREKEAELGRPLTDGEKAAVRQQARIDPKIEMKKQGAEANAISQEEARTAAEQALAGDWKGVTALGRNEVSRARIMQEINKLSKERGMTGADLAAASANFAGATAAARLLGTRGIGIDVGIAEATKFAPMVTELSNKIDRTRYPTINSLQLAMDKGTGGEDVVRLIDAMNAFKMAYTQILSRGGMPTDDSRKRSDEIIDKAWSTGQINAAIDQLGKEMVAARSAVGEVRRDLFSTITGKQAPKEMPAPKPDPKPSEAAGGATDGPPASLLREGVETTFKNGQTWTLKGGQPQRVK